MKNGNLWILISLSILAACATGPEMSSEVQAAKLAADKAREEAIEVKAPKDAETEFNSAQTLYDEAEEAVNSGTEADAIESYNIAANKFLIAAEIARKAKAEAEEAIIEADRKAKTEAEDIEADRKAKTEAEDIEADRKAKAEAEEAIIEANRAIARSEQIVEDIIESVTEGQ